MSTFTLCERSKIKMNIDCMTLFILNCRTSKLIDRECWLDQWLLVLGVAAKQHYMGKKELVGDGWIHCSWALDYMDLNCFVHSQGCLACCSPWGRKDSDTTWWLNDKYIHLYTDFFNKYHSTVASEVDWIHGRAAADMVEPALQRDLRCGRPMLKLNMGV